MMNDETDNDIKKIWKEHYEMELAHLKIASELLQKFENKNAESVIGISEFPQLLTLGENIDYVRDILANTAHNTFTQEEYIDSRKLDSSSNLCKYNKLLDRNPKTDPSHVVIENTIDELSTDYRFEVNPNPIKELQDRQKDNTSVGFPC